MHALLVLLAFAIAAIVTYAVVLVLLTVAERRWHADDPADRPRRRTRVPC
jgi:hypothetical protein